MSNEKWDNAAVEEKLELLRKDITDFAVAHNLLRADVLELLERVAELERNRPKT